MMHVERGRVVVIGGSNGVGLGIAREFKARGYHLTIVDLASPDSSLEMGSCDRFEQSDLAYYDAGLLARLASDSEVSCLMVTAGYGRVASLGDLHEAEIDRLMRVNAVASMRILRQFWSRIHAVDSFFCAVMGSIAGHVPSPLFSAYGASKAALCSFIQSANAELAAEGFDNRILEVSPGSIAGTRFSGGDNDMLALSNLVGDIVSGMFARETLLIPGWKQTYRDVINRAREDPLAFGISSYRYKMDSGRASSKTQLRIGYLSGTFDLFHVGHLRLLRRAKAACDYLTVGVHPSGAHKGKETYVSFAERKEVVAGCRYVDRVIDAPAEDSQAVREYGCSVLFVGDDYRGTERFIRYERELEPLGVRIIYFPYTSGTSSTKIRAAIDTVIARSGSSCTSAPRATSERES